MTFEKCILIICIINVFFSLEREIIVSPVEHKDDLELPVINSAINYYLRVFAVIIIHNNKESQAVLHTRRRRPLYLVSMIYLSLFRT